MSPGSNISLLLVICSCSIGIRSVWGDLQSFKCINNEISRTSGLAGLMPAGQVISRPDTHGISAVQCASLGLKHNDTCFSFAHHEGRCFLKNISLAHPGLLCGTNVLEGRLRCPGVHIGDTFVAFGGASQKMMECMCGVNNNKIQQWSYLSTVSRYDCVDNCSGWPCFVKLGGIQQCWLCNGGYDYCTPSRDRIPTFPPRVGCMPVI